MNYSIQPHSAKGFTAGTKAINDACKILSDINYHPLFIGSNYSGNFLYRSWIFLYDLLKFLVRGFSSEDVFFIQWPYYNNFMPLFYYIIKNKCQHVQLLIHDINSLRNAKHGRWDMRFFQIADLLIVHSEIMKDYLIKCGISDLNIRVLTSFDYLTNDEVLTPRLNSNVIVYAGNLNKSTFLQSVNASDLGIILNCYGKKQSIFEGNIVYKGVFEPEKISVLEGSWGLVWDGYSTDGCIGDFGNYLRYNAPHKLSLYIVAELPILIWKSSALANYVIEKGIGLTISSINEIPESIGSVSQEAYNLMIFNLKREAKLLKSGEHLKSCLL